jgi:hypothetical protein
MMDQNQVRLMHAINDMRDAAGYLKMAGYYDLADKSESLVGQTTKELIKLRRMKNEPRQPGTTTTKNVS